MDLALWCVICLMLLLFITVMGPDFSNAEYFQIRELTPGIWDLEKSVKMPDVIPKIYKVLLNQTN